MFKEKKKPVCSVVLPSSSSSFPPGRERNPSHPPAPPPASSHALVDKQVGALAPDLLRAPGHVRHGRVVEAVPAPVGLQRVRDVVAALYIFVFLCFVCFVSVCGVFL